MDIELGKTYNLKQTKKFFQSCKDHKFELYYQMIFAYKISRWELLEIKWNDIDLDKNTITIYPVKYTSNNRRKNYLSIKRVVDFGRTYPLLPTIKELLIQEKQKQVKNISENDDYSNENNYLCVDCNGKKINANTLSRNVRYIARDNELPEILICGLKNSLSNYFIKNSRSYDYYRAWTRHDILNEKKQVYKKYNLLRNNYFLKSINAILDPNQKVKDEIEM